MLEKENRPWLVLSIMSLSFLAAILFDSSKDREITIDGQVYELISTKKTPQKLGVVNEGGVFKYITQPEQFFANVRKFGDQKWIEIDSNAYKIAQNKLKSM